MGREKIFHALVMNPISPNDVRFHRFLATKGSEVLGVYDSDPTIQYPDAEHVPLDDKIIVPGMVDTHAHLPQYRNVGVGGELTLLDWLNKYTFPAEAEFANPEFAYSEALRFFQHMVLHGTTTASVFATVHEDATRAAFEAAEKVGLRVNMGKVMMNREPFAPPELRDTLEESVAATERLIRRWHNTAGGKLVYSVTPRFAPTSTFDQLEAAGRLWREHGCALQTHLNEDKNEIELVRELFGEHADYTAVYENAGMMGPGAIFAHCRYGSESEIDRLVGSGSSIAHCPASNGFLHNGVMPYMRYKSKGATMGLGSDISGGWRLSMLFQMMTAIENSKIRQELLDESDYMKATDALYLATLGGARALGRENIGNFTAGKQADFVVVGQPHPLGRDNRLNMPEERLFHLCYHGEGKVEQTYVAGECITPDIKLAA